MKEEVGRVVKNNITLVEYDSLSDELGPKYFIQCGIAGVMATKKELRDLYTVLNYYINIDDLSSCQIKVGEEYVAIR